MFSPQRMMDVCGDGHINQSNFIIPQFIHVSKHHIISDKYVPLHISIKDKTKPLKDNNKTDKKQVIESKIMEKYKRLRKSRKNTK